MNDARVGRWILLEIQAIRKCFLIKKQYRE